MIILRVPSETNTKVWCGLQAFQILGPPDWCCRTRNAKNMSIAPLAIISVWQCINQYIGPTRLLWRFARPASLWWLVQKHANHKWRRLRSAMQLSLMFRSQRYSSWCTQHVKAISTKASQNMQDILRYNFRDTAFHCRQLSLMSLSDGTGFRCRHSC